MPLKLVTGAAVLVLTTPPQPTRILGRITNPIKTVQDRRARSSGTIPKPNGKNAKAKTPPGLICDYDDLGENDFAVHCASAASRSCIIHDSH